MKSIVIFSHSKKSFLIWKMFNFINSIISHDITMFTIRISIKIHNNNPWNQRYNYGEIYASIQIKSISNNVKICLVL